MVGEKCGLTLCLVFEEVVDLAGCAVVCDDGVTLVVHVEDEILTLDIAGETLRADVDETTRTMTAKPMRPMSPLSRVYAHEYKYYMVLEYNRTYTGADMI